MGKSCRLPAVVLYLAAVLLMTAYASADEYVIGPEDVLKISFWQDPDLDQTVVVRQDGKITLSIIGEINAAGQTSRDLADRIGRNVAMYNKTVSQATVTVIGFNSQKVYVSGEVVFPGKRAYEVIPDLWTIIKESGGATEFGDLTRVTIIRSKESGGEIITVNVLGAIAAGKLESLPKLTSGDTIEIPKAVGGVPGQQLTSKLSERKNLVYVLGQVRAPGKVPYDGEMDIYDVIGAAGGTTSFADLEKVRIISKNGNGTTVIMTNLKESQQSGQARRIVIKPEDTIVIDEKKRSFLSWGQLRDFAAVAGTIISFIYLIDRR